MAPPDLRITPYVTDHTGDAPERVREWRDTRKMFETTTVISKRRGWRGVFWGMLPASLAAHGLVALGIVILQTWEVTFPSVPPPMIAGYSMMVALSIPPPPPPPPPPPAASVARTQPVERLPDNVAPNAIPDDIPDILPTSSSELPGVEGGVEGGVAGGEIGGSVGGVEGGVAAIEPPPPNTIVVPRDQRLPMKVLSMEYPLYPERWRVKSVEDTLVLKYRVDKKGRVAEVIILQAPVFPEFAEAAIKSIRKWRFQPYLVEGEPMEIIHELTVNFRMERRNEPPPRPAEGPKPDRPGAPDGARPDGPKKP